MTCFSLIYIWNALICALNLGGFLALACLLAKFMHQSLPEVFPISTALWIITLYVLAFFRILSFIDFISVVLIVFCIVLFCRKSTGSRIKELEQLLFSPAAISIYLVLILAFLLFRDLKIADPDDTGCWAL